MLSRGNGDSSSSAATAVGSYPDPVAGSGPASVRSSPTRNSAGTSSPAKTARSASISAASAAVTSMPAAAAAARPSTVSSGTYSGFSSGTNTTPSAASGAISWRRMAASAAPAARTASMSAVEASADPAAARYPGEGKVTNTDRSTVASTGAASALASRPWAASPDTASTVASGTDRTRGAAIP